MPQREVFEDQGAVGLDPAEEVDEDEGNHAGHHRSGRPKANVDKVDGVSRRHSLGWAALRLLRVPPVDAEDPMRLDGLTDRPRRTRRPPWHVTGEIVLAYLVAGALVSGCGTSIKSGKVLLTDSFDNPAAGRLSSQSDDPAVEQGYIGGEYRVRLSSSAKPLRVVAANSVFANLQVAVDARLAEGTEGRSIGVACRMKPKDGTAQFYALLTVPATGRFALSNFDGYQWVHLVPFQSSEAVRRGNASNHLELTCVGSTIIARINGTEVASAQDGTYDSGYVAVVVDRDEGIPLEGRFDNLVVREARRSP